MTLPKYCGNCDKPPELCKCLKTKEQQKEIDESIKKVYPNFS